MELFTVNRYNDPIKAVKTKENEDEILQKLLEKVEKRKKNQKQVNEEKQEHDREAQKHACVEEHRDLSACKQQPSEEQNATAEAEQHIQQNGTDMDPISSSEPPSAVADADGYEFLGEDLDLAKKQKVDMVLPPWLAYPTVIPTNINTTGDSTELPSYLSNHIRQSLKELKVTHLFPVQASVVPWILDAHAKPSPFRPRDICVSAPTGSGKTLAFAIPIVQLLATRVERKIRALVVLPVAELALQVFKVFKKLCERTDLNVGLLSTQYAFALEQEKLVECYKGHYHSKLDIVVTTPGRLVDHLHATPGFCLQSLKFLVIDEADRIMDAVFQNWLYHLDSHVKHTSDMLLSGRMAPLCLNELLQSSAAQPHKLLFSATLSQDPEKLQNMRLFQPKLFTSVLETLEELREKYAAVAANGTATEARGEFIGKYTTPAELTEKYCITERHLKPLTLYSLVKENSWTKFLCFTNSVESSGRLTYVLQMLFKTDLVINELSGSISAKERASVLNKFSRGLINGLICSDTLARGIDIPDVDIVISYDAPRHVKTYIHRIGRTARAGKPGAAITLLTQKELQAFNHALSEVGKVITEEITVSAGTEEEHAKQFAEALGKLRQKVEKDKHTKLIKKERTLQKAILTKDPKDMTFMEKLQMQANEATRNNEQQREKMLSSKKNPSRTFRQKKFNPSAGKSKNIKK